ncbi:MAG: ATP synthase F1 subunit delta, partial [Myxococcales bacterium]|nr:ATP synthase F1 subunit delta [Myxococcales bacterium]
RELDRVGGLFKAPDLLELFRSPKFDADTRKRVLADLLLRVMVSPVCRNFLFLLVDRSRIALLPEIVEAYHGLADAHSGRVRARVTVARTLSEPDVARLRTVLQRSTGREVIVEQEEDPAIIGGMITRIGDRTHDGSIRSQLARLRSELKAAR